MSLPDMTLGGTSSRRAPAPVPIVEPEEFDDEAGHEDAAEKTSAPTRELVQVGDLPDSALKGGRLTAAERAVDAARHWLTEVAASAREVTSRKGGIGDVQPESWNQHRARVKARAWLPEGVRGGLLEWVPVVFYCTVGPVLVAVGRSLDWFGRHMFAFAVAVSLTAAALLLWLFIN